MRGKRFDYLVIFVELMKTLFQNDIVDDETFLYISEQESKLNSEVLIDF